MTISESSEYLSVMAVTAAPGPPVMMTTASAPPVVVAAPAAAHMSVAMAVTALDLDQGAVHRGRGRYAEPGGSGYGHGQRSKQRSSDQNETSHLVSLPSRHRDQAQVPDARVCSGEPKLNPWCDIRASVAVSSCLRAARRSPSRRQKKRLNTDAGLALSWLQLGKSGNLRHDPMCWRTEWLTRISWRPPAPGRGVSTS